LTRFDGSYIASRSATFFDKAKTAGGKAKRKSIRIELYQSFILTLVSAAVVVFTDFGPSPPFSLTNHNHIVLVSSYCGRVGKIPLRE